jgi:hypothetical protein
MSRYQPVRSHFSPAIDEERRRALAAAERAARREYVVKGILLGLLGAMIVGAIGAFMGVVLIVLLMMAAGYFYPIFNNSVGLTVAIWGYAAIVFASAGGGFCLGFLFQKSRFEVKLKSIRAKMES